MLQAQAGLIPGKGHPLVAKEGHDSVTASFSRTYPVLTMYRHDATNPWHLLLTFPTPHPSQGHPHVAHMTFHLPPWATGAWG